MWRPAIWRFGAMLALAACWGRGESRTTTGPLENHGGAAPNLIGGYACAIEDSGYRYPPFRCEIKQEGARLVLVKLDGSQRFEGEVRQVGEGLQFAGQFYCPWGDCTQALHGVFKATSDGGMKGTFSDAKFVVWMQPTGAGFGGVGYGGAAYGGDVYGGTTYGGPSRNP